MHEFVRRLTEHPTLGSMIAHNRRVEGTDVVLADPARPLPAALSEGLQSLGIERLYRHQARGLDLAREGRDVLAVTPTASGKTLLFASCVLESIIEDRESRALFLYPTKALAQDQLGALRQLAGSLGALNPPGFEIYDGDTPTGRRRKIKTDPPNVLISNPDMLHMGILSHHADWQRFFENLKWVVVDELHVYRGIFGAHVHHILARLQRICAKYGARPQFIAASATVGNPGEFAETLVGRPFEVVSTSGAARAPLEAVFLNPVGVSPYTAAVRVVAEAVDAGLKSIAFTKARRITELLYTWLVQQEPRLAERIAPYRAGYLPAERRALESRLFSGELSAILTTSALELGIDVGGLDLCVLVGYPGSLISSWQRIGRVGRNGRDGLVVMVAMPDALDQYIVHHPDLFFGREFEKAVLDPWNPLVAGKHLVCAAAEEPLRQTELERPGTDGRALVADLTEQGRLVQDAAGSSWFSFRRKPHRDVSPRTSGRPYTIVDRGTGKMLGTIDGVRVYHECHPGAIYLHGGQSFLVTELDEDRRQVRAESARVDYFTVVMGEKETEILERLDRKRQGPFHVGLGRFKVTVHIREYQKRRLFGGEPIATYPLDVPPLIFETVGFWIELPAGMPAVFTDKSLHFMGGIHAVEHAIIGLFPLLAIADRGDVAGISYTGHPQIGGPAIFIYDGMPGGAGLSSQGFADLDGHLRRTRELVCGCSCDDGCPACIQSPQCGNGNKPLDKQAASLILDALVEKVSLESLGIESGTASLDRPLVPFRRPEPAAASGDRPPRKHGIARAGNVETSDRTSGRVLVLDIETQRSAQEVGGWNRTADMGLALAVLYDPATAVWRTYYETDVHRLILDLVMADRVVGFNIDRFDLQVLAGYTEWDLGRIRTLDMLADIHRQLGFRLSLNHLAEVNLGEGKAGDGLQSLQWWKEGRIDLIEQYCRKDVELTHTLYDLGRTQGFLLYRDQEDRRVRVPVPW